MSENWVKRFFLGVVICLVSLPLAIVVWHQWISWATRDQHSRELKRMSAMEYGLVLGTSRYAWGMENPYFWYRIDAAEALFRSGKVNYLLLSGDGRQGAEGEPMEMARALIDRGIPKGRLLMDPHGYRTLDSIVRAHQLYGLEKFIIVSQAFHNERALYIARLYGLKEIEGFDAAPMYPSRYKDEVDHREYFARAKVVIDFMRGMKPTTLAPASLPSDSPLILEG